MVRAVVEILVRMCWFPVDGHVELSAVLLDQNIKEGQLTIFFFLHREFDSVILGVHETEELVQLLFSAIP